MQRAAGVAAAVVAVALALWSGGTLRWVLWPRTDAPGHADVVVVLAGGSGERADRGLALVEAGVADAIAVSDGYRPRWPPGSTQNRLCMEPQPFDVVCPYPVPFSTAGEAQTIRRLGSRRGWRSVVVVTSDFHVHRTRTLFSRCLDGPVDVVAATSDTGPLRRLVDVVREVPLVARDELLGPGCGPD